MSDRLWDEVEYVQPLDGDGQPYWSTFDLGSVIGVKATRYVRGDRFYRAEQELTRLRAENARLTGEMARVLAEAVRDRVLALTEDEFEALACNMMSGLELRMPKSVWRERGLRAFRERLLKVFALTPPAGETHQWDCDGERCTKCGDKDWMGGPCTPTPPTGEKAFVDEYARTEE